MTQSPLLVKTLGAVGALLGATLVIAAAAPARAQLLAYEGFSYAAGSGIAGQNGGVGWNGAWTFEGTSNPAVTAPGLSSGGLDVAGNKLSTPSDSGVGFRTLASAFAVGEGTPTLWASFLVSAPGADANSPQFSGVSLFDGPSSANQERLFVGKPFQSTTYGLDARGGAATTPNPAPAVDGTTRLLVLEIAPSVNAGVADVYLYIDPALGTTPARASAVVQVLNRNNFSFDRIRVGGAGGNVTPILFDEIRFGRDFASVTPGAVAPEPASVALAILGAAAGVFPPAGRRRRRATR